MIRFKPDDAVEIINYLEQYRDCLGQMVYLFPILDYEFPEGTVIIEMCHDPESSYKSIMLNLLLPEYPDNVIERIDKVSALQYKKFPNTGGEVFLHTSFAPMIASNGNYAKREDE